MSLDTFVFWGFFFMSLRLEHENEGYIQVQKYATWLGFKVQSLSHVKELPVSVYDFNV